MLSSPAIGQDSVRSENPGVTKSFQLPMYPGGQTNVQRTIYKNLIYPPKAKNEKIGGRVIVGLTIDTLGNVTKVKVYSGVRDDIDKEAIRVAGLLTGWTPGISGGKKVEMEAMLTILFDPKTEGRKGNP
jgi:protein TonB